MDVSYALTSLPGRRPQSVGYTGPEPRAVYYQKLNGAINGTQGVIDFIKYSVEGFIEGLVEQINIIRYHQVSVAWINFVHEQFHNKDSIADVRRRKLIIALSQDMEGVGMSKLTDLNSDLVREYHGKTHKTLIRDVNELLSMELVSKEPKGIIKARWDRILAFLPWQAPDGPVEDLATLA